jgi:hypothetical protein
MHRTNLPCYCPWVSQSERPDELVTLTRCDQLVAAQLLCGRLGAEGIEALIPDENIANQNWHMTRAIGGVRVQVRQADLQRAQQILAEPGAADLDVEAATGRKPNGIHEDDDGTISPGDRAAYRAMRVALVSVWLLGLIHPYSLFLSVRALGGKDVTRWGRTRAWIGLVVSLAGCACLAVLVTKILRSH